jgi:hypothetical protein
VPLKHKENHVYRVRLRGKKGPHKQSEHSGWADGLGDG